VNGRKLIGAAGVVAIVAAGLLGSPRAVQATVSYTRIVHSGPNIADGGTLAAGAAVNICIQPQDSSGTSVAGTVYLSFATAFTPGGQPGGTAKVGITSLNATPGPFSTSPTCVLSGTTTLPNAVLVSYVAPNPYPTPKVGRDVLCSADSAAASAPLCTAVGGITNNDVYTFSPVTSYALSTGPPIASPGTLSLGSAAQPFTVTAFDTTGHSVPGAIINVALTGSAGAPAGFATGVDSTTGTPVISTIHQAFSHFGADQNGAVSIAYNTASSAPASQTDTITAEDHPAGLVSTSTTYSYSTCSGRTLVADFSGGPGADAAAVSNNFPCVMTSTGTGFGTPRAWETGAFFGSRATLAGDINGDGKSDMVAVNNSSTFVLISTGSSFGPPTLWSSSPFYGSVGTYLADVNGDGMADLVAVNSTSTWVMLSTGTGFSPPTLWSSSPFFGFRATLAGDVTGDGKADLVAVNNGSTWVMPSTGTAFGPPTLWSSSPFFGSMATLAGDVTGDGKVDLVAVNNGSTWVMSSNSTGTAFGAPTAWSSSPFFGSVATLAGDVSGDGKVDLVAVNSSSTWVMSSNSTGTAFGVPTLWSTSAF
jgi:hypothetical protein